MFARARGMSSTSSCVANLLCYACINALLAFLIGYGKTLYNN